MFEKDIEVYKKVINLVQAVRYEYESNHQEEGVIYVINLMNYLK